MTHLQQIAVKLSTKKNAETNEPRRAASRIDLRRLIGMRLRSVFLSSWPLRKAA